MEYYLKRNCFRYISGVNTKNETLSNKFVNNINVEL